MHELSRLLYQLHSFECRNRGAFTDDITFVRAQLQKREAGKYLGALILSRRSRFFGEHPTKRTLGDEWQYALSKLIFQIESQGHMFSGTAGITRVFEDYYSNLFKGVSSPSTETEINHFVNLVPQLSDEERSLVDGPLTLEEIQFAITSLQPSKTPGTDGLGSEFYVHFRYLPCPFFSTVFKEAYNQGTLPFTFYQGHTT